MCLGDRLATEAGEVEILGAYPIICRVYIAAIIAFVDAFTGISYLVYIAFRVAAAISVAWTESLDAVALARLSVACRKVARATEILTHGESLAEIFSLAS